MNTVLVLHTVSVVGGNVLGCVEWFVCGGYTVGGWPFCFYGLISTDDP